MKRIFSLVLLPTMLLVVACEEDSGCTPVAEQCNGLDDDCDGLIDEDDVCSTCTPTTEVCDGVDNDCDGAIDEDDVCVTPPLTPDGTYSVETTVMESTCESVNVGDVSNTTWVVTTSGSTLYLDIDSSGAMTSTEYDPATYEALFENVSEVHDPSYPDYVAVHVEYMAIGFSVTSETSKDVVGALNLSEKIYAADDVGGTVLSECEFALQSYGVLM